jgi:hypothetical protein
VLWSSFFKRRAWKKHKRHRKEEGGSQKDKKIMPLSLGLVPSGSPFRHAVNAVNVLHENQNHQLLKHDQLNKRLKAQE